MKTNFFKNNPSIVDTTLRDGEQTPGVIFTTKEKVAIASSLNDLGIEEIEMGIPSRGVKEINAIRTVTEQGFRFRTYTWCKPLKRDIDAARKTGVDGINISFPASEIQFKETGKDLKWVYETMPKIVKYARNYFKYVSIEALDVSRAKSESIHEFVSVCFNHHVYRVRISDTVGILNPISTYKLIGDLTQAFPYIPLEFHGHNGFGNATENTIAAIEAGASYAITTVNGLGERAGNAATEELICALSLSVQNKEKYATKYIKDLRSYVAAISFRPVPVFKPIVGEKTLLYGQDIKKTA